MTKNIIPTINISSIVKSGFESTASINTTNKIKKACINIGFFQVTGHGISRNKIQNICNVGNKFFNSSERNKKKLFPTFAILFIFFELIPCFVIWKKPTSIEAFLIFSKVDLPFFVSKLFLIKESILIVGI